MNKNHPPITAIYAGIGRGHPNYLDSVLRYIRQNHPSQYGHIRAFSVPAISHGLARLGWRGVETVYRTGSRGGMVSLTYTRLRTRHPGYDASSLSARLLGRDLRARLRGYTGLCLVAHPLLAAILQPEHRVFYLHGEIAAPREAAVRGVERIYVPLDETKAKMVARGVDPESVMETGLVLEPEILSDLAATIEQRRQRIASGNPLTAGFFISGAYPSRHVARMTSAVRSCLEAGYRVRLFWGSDSRQVARIIASMRRYCPETVIDDSSQPRLQEGRCVIVTAPGREEETIRSLAYLPGLDIFCAAPHERVNWAAGAGLPMVMVGPPIGSFAPENRGYILRAGCGIELSAPHSFEGLATQLAAMRASGQLSDMVSAGCQIRTVEGAKTIATDLLRHIQ